MCLHVRICVYVHVCEHLRPCQCFSINRSSQLRITLAKNECERRLKSVTNFLKSTTLFTTIRRQTTLPWNSFSGYLNGNLSLVTVFILLTSIKVFVNDRFKHCNCDRKILLKTILRALKNLVEIKKFTPRRIKPKIGVASKCLAL